MIIALICCWIPYYELNSWLSKSSDQTLPQTPGKLGLNVWLTNADRVSASETSLNTAIIFAARIGTDITIIIAYRSFDLIQIDLKTVMSEVHLSIG